MIGLSDLDKYLTLNVSFPVPFDIVWQLLGYSQKSHAKDRLKKKLTLGVHYCYEDMALYKKKAKAARIY